MSAPVVCTRCFGTGTWWFDAYGQVHGRLIPCPVCDGHGLLMDDAMREMIDALKRLRCTKTPGCRQTPGHGNRCETEMRRRAS